MKSYRIILIIFFLICQVDSIYSQKTLPDQLTEDLIEDGFKNVYVKSDDGSLIVFFENSIYRSDIHSIGVALKLTYAHCGDFEKLNLVILKSTIPILYVSVSVNELKSYLESEPGSSDLSEIIETGYNIDRFIDKSVFNDRQNSSRFFTDIIVNPDIGFQLGNYNDPFKFQLNLKPGIYTSLWRGQELGFKANVPLVDRKFVDKLSYLRPEIVTFDQFFRVSEAVFGKLSVGMFSEQRFGFDFESSAYLFKGKLVLNANIAYTGYMQYLKEGTPGVYRDIYNNNVLEKSAINSLQYFANIEYRVRKYDLSLKLGYGEYLYNNMGFSVEMMRNFNEFIIGFRGISGDTGNSLEAHFIIPLLPGKYLKKEKMRIRMAGYYNYYHPIGSAYFRTFSSGKTIDRMLWEINPQFIKNNLYRYID